MHYILCLETFTHQSIKPIDEKEKKKEKDITCSATHLIWTIPVFGKSVSIYSMLRKEGLLTVTDFLYITALMFKTDYSRKTKLSINKRIEKRKRR